MFAMYIVIFSNRIYIYVYSYKLVSLFPIVIFVAEVGLEYYGASFSDI